jgi:hypothetical protein
MFIMSYHSLCIHNIDSMHMHAIGALEGVMLVEFEGTCQEVEEPAPEVQPTEPKASEVVVLECPQHEPSLFMKASPGAL